MKIGVHPSNLHLRLAQVWPKAFAALDPVFVEYGEGRDTAGLIARGSIDFGGTGSTPPIVAEANGRPVSYIAASAARPGNGAIVVTRGGAVKNAADLKGKRIALVDGSFQTYLLAKILEEAGLGLPDVIRIETGGPAGFKALENGAVDAWLSMAPQLEKAERHADFQILARCGSTIPNRSVFWTLAKRPIGQEASDYIVGELARIGQEVMADPAKAAKLLVKTGAGDAELADWEAIVRSRDFTIVAADETILAEQRAEADTLARHGFFSAAASNEHVAKRA